MIQSLLLVLLSCFFSHNNSIPAMATDDSACTLPAPKNLHWEIAGTSYLQMAWDPVPGAAFYRIYFYRSGSGEFYTEKLVLAMPENNIALVDNLPAGGAFTVVVKSVCANGMESPKVN